MQRPLRPRIRYERKIMQERVDWAGRYIASWLIERSRALSLSSYVPMLLVALVAHTCVQILLKAHFILV
jgi:hypothetical protein